MTPKRSPLKPPDVELAPLAAQPDRDGLLDVLRDAEVRREQVRRPGRHDRDRQSPSRRRSSRHRCTVPSPPQTKSSSAPSLQRALDLLRERSGSSAPRSRADRRRPPPRARAAARAGRRRTSCPRARRPRPSSSSRLAPRPGCAARQMRTIAASAATPTRTPPATSSGWCMPRYMRANATNNGTRPRAAQIAICAARFRSREVDQQRDPAVDGDRGGGVAGLVAGVRRAASRGGGPPAAAGGRRASSRGRTPDSSASAKRGSRRRATALSDRGDDEGDTGDDRQHDAAGDDRADRETRRSARPSGAARGSGRTRSSSGATPGVQDDVRHEQAEEDREAGDRGEGDQQADEERPDGMAAAEQRRQPRGRPCRSPSSTGNERIDSREVRRGRSARVER